MRTLLPVLALGLCSLTACAQPARTSADPCGVAGTYEMDRTPVVSDVVASMTSSLADLGARPPEGSVAAVEWSARKDAYESTRADVLDGGIVPNMTLVLTESGGFTHAVADRDGTELDPHTGQWQADAGCETLTIDTGDAAPATARIQRDRLVLASEAGERRGILHGLVFDRVR